MKQFSYPEKYISGFQPDTNAHFASIKQTNNVELSVLSIFIALIFLVILSSKTRACLHRRYRRNRLVTHVQNIVSLERILSNEHHKLN